MKIVIIAVAIFILTNNMIAQEESSFFHHQIGLSVSTFAGSGLTYVHYFANKYAFRIAGFAFYKSGDNQREWDYDIGCEFQRNLIVTLRTRLFALVGLQRHYDFNREKFTNNFQPEPRKFFTEQENSQNAIGAGVGIEGYFLERIAVYLSIGEKLYWEKEKWTSNNPIFGQNDENNTKGFQPSITAGLGYQF